MSFLRRLCPCLHKGGAAFHDGDDDDIDRNHPGDSFDLIFGLHTLQLATNFFSDINRLGHGGFGPVFRVPSSAFSIVSIPQVLNLPTP